MAKLTASEDFKVQVRRAWGQPKGVAEAGMDELFRQPDGSVGDLDYNDQVDHAMSIGILAGETKDQDPERFIQRFEDEILNG